MEAATVPEITPDTLRTNADAAEAEAERLRKRVIDCRAQAARLRREADALEHALRLTPVELPTSRTLLVEELEVWLRRQRKPKSSTEIAEHFGVTQAQARQALEELIEAGKVHRSGLKRGTRYRTIRDGEEITDPTPFGQRWHEHVRDVAVRLHTFTLVEMRTEIPEVAEVTLYRWLAKLVDDGVLTVERVGNRNVYAYEEVEAKPVERRRLDPAPSGARRRGDVVIGTGKRKYARRDVGEIVKAAEAQGAEIKPQKHGYAIVKDGEVIESIARTPGDHRSLKNARANLARAGIDT